MIPGTGSDEIHPNTTLRILVLLPQPISLFQANGLAHITFYKRI